MSWIVVYPGKTLLLLTDSSTISLSKLTDHHAHVARRKLNCILSITILLSLRTWWILILLIPIWMLLLLFLRDKAYCHWWCRLFLIWVLTLMVELVNKAVWVFHVVLCFKYTAPFTFLFCFMELYRLKLQIVALIFLHIKMVKNNAL